MFFCVHHDGMTENVGSGPSLQAAFDAAEDVAEAYINAADCKFYSAVELNVERKFIILGAYETPAP